MRVVFTVVLLLFSGNCIASNIAVKTKRGKGTSGTLTCSTAGVSATCYWNNSKRIPSGTYRGCSATTMDSKGYKGIYIPNVPGFSGIFIHQGSGPEHSDGCIVMDKRQVMKIWNKAGQNKKNITVVIVDN